MSAGIFIERRFRWSRDRETGQAEESLTWEDFGQEQVIVVLGEPGAGKTTEFEHQAARESDANFLTIRKFLRLPLEDPQLRSETLYLDGLDEMRADGSRHGVLDSIITRLIELGRPRVRLSCRAADWFGELDRSQLMDAAPSSKVVVVELQPLSDEEVEQYVQASGLPDTAAFLEMVRRQSLDDWLKNPQTLELMIDVARKGALPATRSGLFEEACDIMAREGNRTHRQAGRTSVNVDRILEAAGLLSAVELIAGLGGFASDPDESDPDFPPLEDMPFSQEELRAAIGSRLFRWSEGRATPIHRTVAEFLAARSLRDLIRKGLPLNRVLRLITGHDGGTLSDLRGLFAWLATLLPKHAEALVARDPAALIFYGDPEPLPPNLKRVVLGELEKLAKREPWFLYQGGHWQAFGGLADSALIPELRAALIQPELPQGYRLSVLAMLAYGHPLREMRSDLVRLVYSSDSPKEVGELGLQALVNVSEASECLSLLEDVHAGIIIDPQDELRAHLLGNLYPGMLDSCQVLQYLTIPSRHSGRYVIFVTRGLLSKTVDANVPDLLDGMSGSSFRSQSRMRRPWPQLIGSLLRRGLEGHGDDVSVERIWSWLQVAQESQGSFLEAKDQAAIRGWFSSRPERVSEMYRWWVLRGDLGPASAGDFKFWRALCEPSRPADLWLWQLSMAESWADKREGEALFRSVVYAMRNEECPLTLGDLYGWAERHPAFRPMLEALVTPPLSCSDPKAGAGDQREEEKEASELAEEFKRNLGAIRTGQHGGLRYLAERFLYSICDPFEAESLDSFQQELGPEIAVAAESGFLATLERSDLPTPEQIGESAAHGREFPVCIPVLAGAVLRHKAGTLPRLRESPGLRVALAFEFAQTAYRPPRWFDSVIEEDPDTAASVIGLAWRPLLRSNADFVPHFYSRTDKVVQLIAQRIGLSLLREFSRSRARLLQGLMHLALAGSSREDLEAVARVEAARPHGAESRRQHTLWLALLALVCPADGLERIKSYLARGQSTEKGYALTDSLGSLSKADGYSLSLASSAVLAKLVQVLGKACPSQPAPEGGWAGRHDPYESSRFVGELINLLASRLEDDAAAHLQELRDNRSLGSWREKLSQAVEQQRRKIREARYQRPSLGDTVKVLQGGEPTNVADLHAIVCDHLRTFAEEIEKGPESGYQNFWNVKGAGALESPVPENEARNRLRSLINPRLKPLGISAEIEGHYTGSRRADLKVIFRSMNVPVEIKRSDHRKVWTAPREQLKAKYSIDPGAGGFGIYLVFWFGADEGQGLPKPPPGVARPSTAAEMEAALRQIYSGEEWRDIEFLCIDCSRRSGDSRL